MQFFRCSLVLGCLAAAAAGCTRVPATLPATPAAAGRHSAADPSAPRGFLYVANAGSDNAVSIYAVRTWKLVRTISVGVDNPRFLGVSPKNDLYVGNGGTGPTPMPSIAVYAPGALTPTATLQGTSYPTGIAFDVRGRAFVSNYGGFDNSHNGSGSIGVYGPRQSVPARYIYGYSEVNEPLDIATDAAGDVYVTNDREVSYSYTNGGTVTEFSRAGKLLRTISSLLLHANALAVDTTGNLYVANTPPRSNPQYPGGYVTEYVPGQTTPSRMLTQGVHSPTALAVDAQGNLYVANARGRSLAVFGPSGEAPIRMISRGIRVPSAIAIDPAGFLYVADSVENSVTVYAPGGSVPIEVLRKGVVSPVALALRPAR